MSDKIMAKDRIASFIDHLKGERDLYAPSEYNGRIVWAQVDKAEDVLWDFANTRLSPKDFFFPQTECMMRFVNRQDGEDGMVMQAEPGLARERVLLNMRPCDAKAFGVLDLIFCQDQMSNDTYWRDKRDKTLIVSLACDHPSPTCFCTSMNCGPHHEDGSDLLLVDLGESFLVKGLTEKGEAAIAGLPEAGPDQSRAAAEARSKAEAAITSKVGMDQVESRDLMELFNADHWDRLHETCLNCGACTFCCPTCHCFDIQDETEGEQGVRVRNWDYCMSYLFTLHGSGHNPRPGKKERVRQRFMHKFKYIPLKRGGEIGCVGCGRCVQQCPVNIDVREVIENMNA